MQLGNEIGVRIKLLQKKGGRTGQDCVFTDGRIRDGIEILIEWMGKLGAICPNHIQKRRQREDRALHHDHIRNGDIHQRGQAKTEIPRCLAHKARADAGGLGGQKLPERFKIEIQSLSMCIRFSRFVRFSPSLTNWEIFFD